MGKNIHTQSNSVSANALRLYCYRMSVYGARQNQFSLYSTKHMPEHIQENSCWLSVPIRIEFKHTSRGKVGYYYYFILLYILLIEKGAITKYL